VIEDCGPGLRIESTPKTISIGRMFLSFAAFQKKLFPRRLALCWPRVGFSNGSQSRYLTRFTIQLASPVRFHAARSLASSDTKRTRHLVVASKPSQFHINFVLIVLPHRLGNLYHTSLESVGPCRGGSSPLLGTGYPETRGRQRGRCKKTIPTQCRHQT
jgi:hypothetical protein